MTKHYLLSGLLLGCLTTLQAQSVTRLLAASPYDDILRVLDTNSYATITSRTLQFTNGTSFFDGCTGLARNPSTNVFYIVGKDGSDRHLGTLDPLTGQVTSLGLLGDKFAQITFNSLSTLEGVTGDGGNLSETFFRINQNDASNTVVTALGNGNDGECICYQPQNNKVYHWSGNGTVVYERFDTTGANLTNVAVQGGYSGEIFGAVYKTNGKFVVANIDAEFRMVDTLGNFDAPATTYSTNIKGLAYITCPRVISGSFSLCPGSATTLSMSPGGEYYQWYRNNVAVAGATAAVISATQAGHYNCIISDACGLDSLAIGVTVQLLNAPVVNISGSSTVCAGQSVTLSASSGGTSQWYRNGVLIQGATSNTFLASQAGVYNMIKTNTNGCSDSAAVGKVLTVIQPTISISASASVVCEGSVVTFTASGAQSYSWSTSLAAQVLTVTPLVTSLYTLTGTDASACQNTAAVSVTVNPLPPLMVSSSQSVLCEGETATLTASGAATYSWTNGPAVAEFTVNPLQTTSYTLSGTGSNGCSKTVVLTQSVALCTGLAEQQQEAPHLSLYPNPASGSVILRTDRAISVTISNQLGQVQLQLSLSAGETVLDVQELPSGIYTITSNGQRNNRHKLVIAH